MKLRERFRQSKKQRFFLRLSLGVFLLVLPFPESVISTIAPLGEWIDHIQIYAPEVREEFFHETALKEEEISLRRKLIPTVKTHFNESFVQSNMDSGFLNTVEVRLPIFEKTRNYLQMKIARLEKESYQAARAKIDIERVFHAKLLYYERERLLQNLPILVQEKKILSELVRHETKLTEEKIKPLDALAELSEEKLLVDEKLGTSRVLLERIKAELAYLSGVESETLDMARRGREKELMPQAPLDGFSKRKDFALTHHPDLILYKLEIEKAKAKTVIAGRDWLPEISAVSSYARDPRFARNENQLFAGVEVNFNLWDFGAGRHEARKEEALYEEAKAKWDNTRKKIAFQIDNALRSYKLQYSVWVAYKTYFEFQTRVMKSADHRLREGEISRKDHSLARLRFLKTRLALQDAKTEALKKEAELLRSLGLIWLAKGNRT